MNMWTNKGDNLVVFYYLSASESWSDKRDVLWVEERVARETTALQKKKYYPLIVIVPSRIYIPILGSGPSR